MYVSLGSSLFSRFSGIVICRLVFCALCLKPLMSESYDNRLSGFLSELGYPLALPAKSIAGPEEDLLRLKATALWSMELTFV